MPTKNQILLTELKKMRFDYHDEAGTLENLAQDMFLVQDDVEKGNTGLSAVTPEYDQVKEIYNRLVPYAIEHADFNGRVIP